MNKIVGIVINFINYLKFNKVALQILLICNHKLIHEWKCAIP